MRHFSLSEIEAALRSERRRIHVSREGSDLLAGLVGFVVLLLLTQAVVLLTNAFVRLLEG